jgi:hypothetical protein
MAIMSVRLDGGKTWSASAPTKLFQGSYYQSTLGIGEGRTFDVSPDGRRFLMIKDATDSAAQPYSLVVIQNWFEELKRRVPRN